MDATREFASDGSFETADVFTVTSSATGTGTVTLLLAQGVGKVFILSGVNGSVLGEVDAPKISNARRSSLSVGREYRYYLYEQQIVAHVNTVSLIQLHNRLGKTPKIF